MEAQARTPTQIFCIGASNKQEWHPTEADDIITDYLAVDGEAEPQVALATTEAATDSVAIVLHGRAAQTQSCITKYALECRSAREGRWSAVRVSAR